jgi:hypothetical protein
MQHELNTDPFVRILNISQELDGKFWNNICIFQINNTIIGVNVQFDCLATKQQKRDVESIEEIKLFNTIHTSSSTGSVSLVVILVGLFLDRVLCSIEVVVSAIFSVAYKNKINNKKAKRERKTNIE